MHDVIQNLERLRRHTRRILIAQRSAVILAATIAAITGLVLVDYLVRWPSGFRLVLLVAGLGALGWAVARYVVSAIGYAPTLTQLALRVESLVPPLAGRLASGVEFTTSGLAESNAMAARSVRDLAARFGSASTEGIVRRDVLMRHGAMFVAALVVAAFLVSASPGLARTGLNRLFLPLGATQWPARTAVASLMDQVLDHDSVYPRGKALLLRAANETRGEPDGRVDVRYRYVRDGAHGAWESALLTHQGDGVHERLVDTEAEAIEFAFATSDAETQVERVDLVPPPAVRRAGLTVDPPAYAVGRRAPMAAELGPGLDERSVTEEPVLVGSRATLVVELNKALPVPESAPARAAWLAETVRGATDVEFVPESPTEWRIAWTLAATTTLDLNLRDQHGLGNDETIRYRVEAAEDLPPSVSITEPASDEAVLPTAIVPVVAEADDDVAVARLALTGSLSRGGSAGRESMPAIDQRMDVDQAVGVLETDLDLAVLSSELALQAGDVIVLQAVAEDAFELDGRTHAPVLSAERRLRLVSELDFAAQLRQELGSVRQSAIRIEAMQSELQDDVIDQGLEPGQVRAQAELSERIADQRDAVAELERQVERNRLEDPQLRELFQQSRDLLDYAGRAASEAVDALENADRDEPDADQPVVEAQQEVRDELADLIELLDRDEDTWIVQRQLEGLLGEQQDLQAATEALARETMGLDRSDMDPVTLSELDRIAQRQRDLRDEARRLIEEMRRRAEAMDEVDPQAASGMRSAADTGERGEVDRDMEAAAQRVDENQLQTANAAQQAAMQTLERMNEDLQEDPQARAAELLRQLASLIESIDRLITLQENELMLLDAALARDDFAGRDRAMIRLTQNTQAVASDARAAGPNARRVARALDRAADAQGESVTGLRTTPIPYDAVREAEDHALSMLQEAKAFAEELEQRTEEDQVEEQRAALIESYRALAEQQVALREQTLPIISPEALTRRQLVEARRFGNVQDQIRTALADLEAATAEIADSEVFSLVHRLMDGWSRSVSDALWDGRVTLDVTDRQARIADSIARQITALEESTTPPDAFDDGAGGEQAGGAGANSGQAPPLIPPAAEIKRLHGLQEQVYNETRDVDAREDLDPAARRERVRELGSLQRELMRVGEKMLESMQQGPAGGPPPPPAPDAAEPAPVEPGNEPETRWP